MARKQDEEERQRLLRQVSDLEAQARRMQQQWGVSRPYASFTTPTLYMSSSGSITFSDPLTMAPIKLSKPTGAWFEVKIWHEDGRYEVVRGYQASDPLLITDKNGTRKNIAGPNGDQRKIEPTDRVSLSGVVMDWKRGPDGRPIKPSK